MFHNNVPFVYFMVYCLYFIDARATNNLSELDCSQFTNDQDILRQLPFPVEILSTTWRDTNMSTFRMRDDGAFVDIIQIRNEKYLPSSIFCLTNLTYLLIENTPFENDIVPDALGNLKALLYFDIIGSPIKKMSEQLLTLTNLEVLMLDNCSLTQLPDIRKLPKLMVLYLPFNKFDSNQLDQLLDLNLEVLDLSGNNLTQIPILKKRDNLIYLTLDNNPIQNADSIILYPNLTCLYMSDTMLTSIPSNIDQLQELEQIIMNRNQLTDLPASIFNSPKLDTFAIEQNLFTPKYIQSIKRSFKKYRPSINLFI